MGLYFSFFFYQNNSGFSFHKHMVTLTGLIIWGSIFSLSFFLSLSLSFSFSLFLFRFLFLSLKLCTHKSQFCLHFFKNKENTFLVTQVYLYRIYKQCVLLDQCNSLSWLIINKSWNLKKGLKIDTSFKCNCKYWFLFSFFHLQAPVMIDIIFNLECINV